MHFDAAFFEYKKLKGSMGAASCMHHNKSQDGTEVNSSSLLNSPSPAPLQSTKNSDINMLDNDKPAPSYSPPHSPLMAPLSPAVDSPTLVYTPFSPRSLSPISSLPSSPEHSLSFSPIHSPCSSPPHYPSYSPIKPGSPPRSPSPPSGHCSPVSESGRYSPPHSPVPSQLSDESPFTAKSSPCFSVFKRNRSISSESTFPNFPKKIKLLRDSPEPKCDAVVDEIRRACSQMNQMAAKSSKSQSSFRQSHEFFDESNLIKPAKECATNSAQFCKSSPKKSLLLRGPGGMAYSEGDGAKQFLGHVSDTNASDVGQSSIFDSEESDSSPPASSNENSCGASQHTSSLPDSPIVMTSVHNNIATEAAKLSSSGAPLAIRSNSLDGGKCFSGALSKRKGSLKNGKVLEEEGLKDSGGVQIREFNHIKFRVGKRNKAPTSFPEVLNSDALKEESSSLQGTLSGEKVRFQ